jgi:hypothetical protein
MRNLDAISYDARLWRIYLIKNYGPLEYMVYLVVGCSVYPMLCNSIALQGHIVSLTDQNYADFCFVEG